MCGAGLAVADANGRLDLFLAFFLAFRSSLGEANSCGTMPYKLGDFHRSIVGRWSATEEMMFKWIALHWPLGLVVGAALVLALLLRRLLLLRLLNVKRRAGARDYLKASPATFLPPAAKDLDRILDDHPGEFGDPRPWAGASQTAMLPMPPPVHLRARLSPAPNVEIPACGLDNVPFMLTGPARAAPGSTFQLQFCAHLLEQLDEVIHRARTLLHRTGSRVGARRDKSRTRHHSGRWNADRKNGVSAAGKPRGPRGSTKRPNRCES